MVWTCIAAWFCYNSPLLLNDGAGARGGFDAQLDVSRSVLQRVAQGFADFIVENSKREDRSMGWNGAAQRHCRLGSKLLLVQLSQQLECSTCSCKLGAACTCKAAVGGGGVADVPQLDAPHLSLFKELLKDRLVANLMFEGGTKLGGRGSEGTNWLGSNLLPSRWFDDVPFAASMADHARAIGDKCFKEGQFVAAVHCYEVATLLCPSGR
eukprot:Skav228746  [mRNA]  locus=scaffold4149:36527:41783:- [translate_table: standard]